MLNTDVNTTTPIIVSLAFHGVVNFARRKQFQFAVVVTDNIRSLSGSDVGKGKKLAGVLREAATRTWVELRFLEENLQGEEKVKTYRVKLSNLDDNWGMEMPDKYKERAFGINAVEVALV